ncbi:Chondrocyte-derived ezrin-like domain containing protein [Carabus blaptoides fortunei]
MPMERDPVTGGSVGQLSTGAVSLGGGGAGGMHHSHSTPAGVDGGGARTPPTTPKKGGKMLAVRVQMLDDTVTMFQVQAKALGRVLFDQVCKQLHLLEADYFGLEYQDMAGTRYWLDLQKPVSRQLGLSLVDPLLQFCVKFYTPDPAQLEEEFTRYLFCLQVKRDLAQGLLQCNDNTAALMASYIVQAECGDYVVEDYPDHTYLSSYKFVPHQDQELERRIMENHKKHAAQSPAEADLNLLETARRCELYGMKMHPAKDHEGVPLNLAVAHMGLVVFQNYTKINTFSWAKIRKISFKRKRFLIKLHPEGYGYYKDTVEFFFEGRNECKNFWKKCVENHGFFRCSSVKHVPRHKTRVLSRGSSFRYSGKTQKQIVEFVRDNYVKRQTFQRSASFRHSSAHSSAANVHASLVGNSISAHPLLPLADNSLANAGQAGSNLSTSLGSMGAVLGRGDRAPASPTTRGVYRPPDTATCWNTARSTTPVTPPGTSSSTRTTTPAGVAAVLGAGLDSRTMSSPSPPLTMQSVTPPTSAATSPQRTMPLPGLAAAVPPPHLPTTTTTIINSSSSSKQLQLQQQQQRTTITAAAVAAAGSPVAVRAAVHRADTDNHAPANLNTTILSENNNLFFASTPNAKNVNGNDMSLTNSHSSNRTKVSDDISPVKQFTQEDIMNSVNANTTTTNGTLITAEGENEIKKKPRWPTDKAYFIAKEILTTELTYKKDLDVINVWFREEVASEKPAECNLLLTLISPLANAHGQLVRDLEQRLQAWEGRGGFKGDTQRVGDVLLTHLPPLLPLYEEYIDGHLVVLERLDAAFKQDSRFEQLYRDFELQKVCYLPLTTFVLKPLHRLLHYKNLLDRLLKHYAASHPDYADLLTANATLAELITPVAEMLSHSENLAALCELQRDIIGFDSLVQPGRKFIRHGCLLKHSRKGYQQRMFFLFSDILLYTSRSQAALQFKVHGHMPLRGVMLEEPDGDIASYAFIIYGGNRALTVAANSQDEKERWVEDLSIAIQLARDRTDAKLTYLSLKSCSSSDEIMDQCGTDQATQTKPSSQRSNTTVHVCWHRNTSISMDDQLVAAENQLSGYLLRKFKSSNGWQKLWVVFTSFCLFFYKSCMDEFPLASLPLLGYAVGAPNVEDAIGKEYVFKLQYKNHVYFFRAESEYTYNRWMEVIGSATQSNLRRYTSTRRQLASNESSPDK